MIGITGATGFIGQKLKKKLLISGKKVIDIDLRNLNLEATIATLKENSVHCIIHLASPTPSSLPGLQDEIENVIIRLGKLAIGLAEKVGAHLVVASTIRIHPHGVENFSKTAEIAPFDGYGRGKFAVERLCRERFGFDDVGEDGNRTKIEGGKEYRTEIESKIGCDILRISSVQGIDNAGRARGLVGLFARQASTGKLTIMGDGSSTKDLLHVDDLVAAICAAVESADGSVREMYVGSGIGYTVKEIANAVVIAASIRGKSIEIVHIEADPDDLSGSINDNSAAKYLEWSTEIDLDMMISEALDFVLIQGG